MVMMKIKVLMACCMAVVAGTVFPQSRQGGSSFEEFREAQLRKMTQFSEAKRDEMAAFRDSLNRAYAVFLEQKWESFNLYREERGFRPMPEPPVYDPAVAPVPGDEPQPVADVPVASGQYMAEVLPPQMLHEMVKVQRHIIKTVSLRRHQQSAGTVMSTKQVTVPFLQGKEPVDGRPDLTAHVPVV